MVTMESSDESFRFCLGESFSTYHDLKVTVKDYKRLAAVQLTHRDLRTLEGIKNHVPKRVEANPQLVYYSIYLSCVLGRKNIRTKVQDKEELSCKCLT